eukprot:760554-Hanusia_phi.AAC.3
MQRTLQSDRMNEEGLKKASREVQELQWWGSTGDGDDYAHCRSWPQAVMSGGGVNSRRKEGVQAIFAGYSEYMTGWGDDC